MGVAVFFGSGKLSDSDNIYQATCLAAKQIAAKGYDIASGGYGGVMEASLRGALDFPVKRIGVTCDLFSSRVPNDFLSDEIKTKNYFERLEILIDLGDIFIAMEGESGTLLEVAAIMAFSEREFIEDRKLVLFGNRWQSIFNDFAMYSNMQGVYYCENILGFNEILSDIIN